jgi:hypothetical protein
MSYTTFFYLFSDTDFTDGTDKAMLKSVPSVKAVSCLILSRTKQSKKAGCTKMPHFRAARV